MRHSTFRLGILACLALIGSNFGTPTALSRAKAKHQNWSPNAFRATHGGIGGISGIISGIISSIINADIGTPVLDGAGCGSCLRL
jgi:hypothetical protein